MHRFTTAAAGMTLSLVLMPVFAHADTVTDLQNQIQTLLSQLKTLQTQLWQAKASTTVTTPPAGNAFGKRCVELNRDIREGHRGDDVKEIQKFLREHKESGFSGSDTGFFGSMTKKAVEKFAKHNGIALVNGTLPREVFMRDCISDLRGGEVRGTVLSVASSTFTVSLTATTTRSVTVNATTSIKLFTSATSTATNGTFADIAAGKVVKVEGAPQTDGSLLAREVKIFPAGTVVTMENGHVKPLKKMFDNRGRRSGGDDD